MFVIDSMEMRHPLQRPMSIEPIYRRIQCEYYEGQVPASQSTRVQTESNDTDRLGTQIRRRCVYLVVTLSCRRCRAPIKVTA
jgi:hypothetical protein